MAEAVRVEGLAELNRAFGKLSKDIKKELHSELRRVGEPVRAEAERRASAEITNIGEKWNRMRVGATTKVVYVAPRAHRRGGSPRPNLAPLLMERAMEPALEAKQGEVVNALDHMLDRLAGAAGF